MKRRYDINGMLVTTDGEHERVRRRRIEDALAIAETELAAARWARSVDDLAIATAKEDADTHAALAVALEAARLGEVAGLTREIDRQREAISQAQKSITEAERAIAVLLGDRVREVQAQKDEAALARSRADLAAQTVDRKHGRRLREAENAVERCRTKLIRLDLRTSARKEHEAAPVAE